MLSDKMVINMIKLKILECYIIERCRPVLNGEILNIKFKFKFLKSQLN